jgi:glycosyltransferase involved in cell wall biosynthesis
MKLSILIPVYNEEETIEEVVIRVKKTEVNKEIIIVDDASDDSTRKILNSISQRYGDGIKIIYRENNGGKGAAIKTGLDYVSGDTVIIQDVDLEYDPAEYAKLISPIRDNYAQVVYGSRFLAKKNSLLSLHYFANYFLTTVTNLLFNTTLTDMETCYKVLKKILLKN